MGKVRAGGPKGTAELLSLHCYKQTEAPDYLAVAASFQHPKLAVRFHTKCNRKSCVQGKKWTEEIEVEGVSSPYFISRKGGGRWHLKAVFTGLTASLWGLKSSTDSQNRLYHGSKNISLSKTAPHQHVPFEARFGAYWQDMLGVRGEIDNRKIKAE